MTRTAPRNRTERARRDREVDRDRSYRPRSPPPPSRYAPTSYANDRNHYEADSWRPGDRRQGGGPSREFRDEFRDEHRGSDNYRPRPPQSDFTFRVDKPAGIPDFSVNNSNNRNYPERNRPRRGPAQGRRGGRPRWQPPPHPSERALISGITANLPEERLGDLDNSAKFRAVDDLSDDDELDMDISSSSEKSDTEGPSKKRARTTDATDSGDAAPKWSNPDPYTALPCPDESQRKKKDMVKLIRKARLEEEAKAAAPPEAEDFISFDLTEEEESADEAPPPPPPPTELPPRPPPPPPSAPSGPRADTGKQGAALRDQPSVTKNQPLTQPDRSGPLGSRKRTADDEIKPPDYGQLKKVSMKPVKGMLVYMWQPKPDEEGCPWAIVDHSATTDMPFRLHKEVMDFYDYVRPRKFEQRIRDELLENLRKAMRRDGRNFVSATVRPFGSFMSGLYLPTADMDLVVCSASYMRGGPPTYLSARSWLYKFQKFLIAQRVADGDSIEVIAHARVPLVKFVDKLTGLKVDVSFENLGGVDAVDTFLRWKEQYPAMPIIVTVIKHYLLMRGLNEPVNGGIGGFSVICLVVSMLQLMPQVQSRSLIPEHHLGEMLLEFFSLYGRHFRHETNAISLTRPIGYIRKSEVQGFTYKNTDRLSIIDPNNPSNDISGGSSNTNAILARFHDAYNVLRERMREVARNPEKGSILEVLLKGDYSSFRMQRDYLRHVHEKHIGPCSD
ncbi:Fc.00g044740.m01.CDS01 [Cosmosporella sp. VM-42]